MNIPPHEQTLRAAHFGDDFSAKNHLPKCFPCFPLAKFAPESQETKVSEYLRNIFLPSNVPAGVFARFASSLRIQTETKHFCLYPGSHEGKMNLKSADHCCRGLKLAVDETKQLKLNEINAISKFLGTTSYNIIVLPINMSRSAASILSC